MSLGQDFIPQVDPNFLFSQQAKLIHSDIKNKKPILLTGHTGTGKTSMIMQLAAKDNQPCIRVNLNNQITVSDFVGTWGAKDGSTVWIDGALTLAMRHGWWIILDEFDYGAPEILCLLNNVLEKNPTLLLKEKDAEIVRAHENFRVIATGNTIGCMSKWRHLYQGTNLMNEAMVNRWRVYLVDYLKFDDEVDVVLKSVKLPSLFATQLVKVASMARQAFVKEELTCTFSTRMLLDWADCLVSTTLWINDNKELKIPMKEAPLLAAGPTIFNKIADENSEVLKSIIQRVIYNKEKEEVSF